MRERRSIRRAVARVLLGASLAAGVMGAAAPPAAAQTVRDVFRSVTPSVVVIRARGGDVTAAGQTRFLEAGSGVLISADGKAHPARDHNQRRLP